MHFLLRRNAIAQCFVSLLLVGSLMAASARAQNQGPGGAKKIKITYKQIIRAISAGNEASRRRSLGVLAAQLANDPRVPKALVEVLGKVRANGNVPDSVLMMIKMLEKHDQPEVIETLVKLLDAKNAKIVIVAVGALGTHKKNETLDAVLALGERSDFEKVYGFRRAVVTATIRFQDSRAVEAVVKLLPRIGGRLQFDLVRYLSHISRQQFGTRHEDWTTWWQDNAKDFSFTENRQPFLLSKDVSASEFKWNIDVPQFYGISIYAQRMVFILDRSSSMTAKLGKETRFNRCQREVIGAISLLPETAFFNIVFYDARTGAWKQKGLVRATQENRLKAVRFIEYMKTGSGTASYDALEHGFRLDGNIETIIFLSDGIPTRGKITDQAKIIQVITKMNFFRQITIHAIAVGNDDFRGFMQQLAKKNGGQFRHVE